MASYSHLRVARPHAGVALMTLDNPDQRNAMSDEMTESWVAAVAELAADKSLRAVVVTGQGSAFCSGADLVTRFEPAGSASGMPVDSFRPAFDLVLDAIVDHPAPVITIARRSRWAPSSVRN